MVDTNNSPVGAATNHLHHHRVQYVVETVQVGTHHHIPVVLAQGRECAVAGQAGVEHHAVVGTVGFNISLENGFTRAAVRHVELQHPGIAPEGLDFALDGLRLGASAATVQHDVVPGLGQTQGDGTADATAGAGDQYGFSHGVFPVADGS